MLNAFVDYLALEKKYSKHTVKAYRNDIQDFLSFVKLEFDVDHPKDVIYSFVRNWVVRLVDDGLSNRTINRKTSSLKAFFSFLQRVGEINTSPMAKHVALKIKKKALVPFSKDEVDVVLNALSDREDYKGLRDLVLVELFYSTGIRRAEMLELKVNDIDLEKRHIKVLGKRNKERIVPLITPVITTLKKYLKRRNLEWGENGYLLLNNKGVKMNESFVYRTINDYFSKVSQKVKTSPHVLRHSFATHLLNEGADLNSVKELLGHTSLAATQVYTHSTMAELSKIYAKSHPRTRESD